MIDKLSEAVAVLGVTLPVGAHAHFETLHRLLLAAGTTQNLTAIRDSQGILERHFLESLAAGSLLDQRGLLHAGARILDLGSGAGFPGLPVKFAWPAIQLTLLEATVKKARFIEAVVEETQIANVRVVAERAETFAHRPEERDQIDVVIARAVAPLPTLVELALPLLCLGGMLAAIKGSRADDEIAAAQPALNACAGELTERLPLQCTESMELLLIRKIGSTPDQYPRRPGLPATRPIRSRG